MPRHAVHLLLPLALGSSLAVAQVDLDTVAQVNPDAKAADQYKGLTNPLSAATNFNIETVRGVYVAPDALYAINTHASTIVRHVDLVTPAWENEWATVHHPVAITMWNNRLLVVGGSSWSLAEHDRQSGRMLRHVDLPAEPADIVVDAGNNWAYVACQGDNLVVRIDLLTFTENARYPIPAQRPRFLFLDTGSDPATIYTAPSLSGNNTTLRLGTQPSASGPAEVRSVVVDLDATTTPGGDLPDEDLFRITGTQGSNTPGTPVLHGAGTLLTEHARNPVTQAYWMLSVRSRNAAFNSEDQHRGVFANAQLAIANNLGIGTRPTPGITIDLDLPIGGGAKSTNTSMSFPFALAFHSSGYAAIASSTSDLITLVTSTGTRFYDIPITQVTSAQQPGMPTQIGRAIPRDMWFDNASNALFVYLWGWNKVFVYDFNNITTAPFWLDLGPDPLPIAVQQGRSIFYDAKRTAAVGMPGAVTCNTCHPGGGMDLLGWGLSDSHKDIKDLMVTQSLLSISDLAPYHWRGERQNLDHFNGAFEGLLGHKTKLDETPGGELDQFEAFVFSLQAPANPRQDISRTLVDLSARKGQQVFINKPNVLGPFTCAACHAFPGGTNGDVVAEVFFGIASTTSLDVSHLRQLRHKDQGAVQVVIPDQNGNPITVTRARQGFGLAHEGVNFDVPDFIKPRVSGGPFGITVVEQGQISEFVRQFDQGIAPAAHRAYWITPTNKVQVGATITAVLLTQAATSTRWVDVAAIGYETVGAATRDLRWAYDPATGLFTCHDASVAPRTFAAFTQAITGPARYLFVGLPPGNAVRYALDPDNDGLPDAQEAIATTQPRNRDTDGDGYDDGYEVQVASNPLVANVPFDNAPPALLPGTTLVRDHNTSTSAKFLARFTEPVTWRLEALDVNNNNAIVSVTRSPALQREAVIHMHELYPSSPGTLGGDTRRYAPRLVITDPRGNPTTITGAQFAAADQLVVPPRLQVTIDNLAHATPPARGSGTLAVSATVRVRYKAEVGGTVPVSGRVVVAHVLKRPAGSQTWTAGRSPAVQGALLVPIFNTANATLDPTGTPYRALPGDFLLSTPTNANGDASFNFSHSGLVVGDDVRLSIVAVLEPYPSLPLTFELFSLFDWDLPTTAGGPSPTVPGEPDLRGLTTQY